MQLSEVTDQKGAQDFLRVNVEINRLNKNYIRPLDKDIHEIFNPAKNKTYRFGKAIRWVLKNERGEMIGRIAAFTNKRYKNKGDDVPVGGIGFFDCIDNQTAGNMLFDVARQWLSAQGMEAMDGPINFGERDRWWGLVVDGFQEPLYGMNFNAAYYKELFENYGFQPFFHQVCFGMNPKEPFPAKIWERHDLIAKDKAFKVICIHKSQFPKFAEDFTVIYNGAWAGHGGMKQLRKEQVEAMFRQMKPVMDERMIWFAYHHEKPVAMFVNIPDLNQWFKYLNGKFNLWHKLKFLWIKKTIKGTKFNGLVFGVVPEFQGMGVDAYIIGEAAKMVLSPSFEYYDYEMQWIGDFNPKMINVAQGLGDVRQSRKLTTYRFLFDRTKPFKRHPILA